MRRSLNLALLLAICLGASAVHADRSFDWAIVDTLDLETNPFWVQSCLDLTPAGEPVRAHLVRNRSLQGFHYLGDFRLTHYDQQGNPLWSGDLQGKVHVEDLQVDSTGAIVLHGVYTDSLYIDAEHMLLDGSGDRREYLLKLDAAREVEWLIDLHTLDPSIDDVKVITVDPDDRVWVGTSRFGSDSEILRLDADGQVAEVYLQSEAIYVTGLAVEPDGTVWAAGFCSDDTIDFNGTPLACPFHYAFYLVKYAPDGQAEWAQFFEDITFQGPHLISDGAGGVYFAGEQHGMFEIGGIWPEGIDWVYDFFLCRVDTDGNFLWLREVPTDDFLGDGSMGKSAYLATQPDGSLYFAGFSRGSVDWVGDGNPQPSWEGNDALILHYTPDGECLWAKTAGSDWHDIADAIGVDQAGNVFIAGSVHDGAMFDDLVFPGNFINTFIASLPAEDLTAAPESVPAPELRLGNHPNPFNPSTRITFNVATAGSVELTVYDPRGARLVTLPTGWCGAGEHTVEWDGRDSTGRTLPSGVYLARLETTRGVATRRMVMLR